MTKIFATEWVIDKHGLYISAIEDFLSTYKDDPKWMSLWSNLIRIESDLPITKPAIALYEIEDIDPDLLNTLLKDTRVYLLSGTNDDMDMVAKSSPYPEFTDALSTWKVDPNLINRYSKEDPINSYKQIIMDLPTADAATAEPLASFSNTEEKVIT